MEHFRNYNINFKKSFDIELNNLKNNHELVIDTVMTNNFILELDEDGNNNLKEDELYVIPNYTNLVIKLFNGLHFKNLKIATNAYTYISLNEIKSLINESERDDIIIEPSKVDIHIYFNLKIRKPGPIFFILFNDNFIKEEFYILSEPSNVNEINLQTVLSKSIGKIKDWKYFFQEVSSLKYNYIHFTPIQEIGSSDSLYCIRDQNEINNYFFEDDSLLSEEKLNIVKHTIQEMRDMFKIGSFIDIVLNHTASNSDWINKNPESGYNLLNTPHLNSAYEMDNLLLDYSKRYADKKVGCKSAPFINNDNDLNELISELSKEIYKKNFEEYFLISIEKYIPLFEEFYSSYKKDLTEFLSKKKFIHDKIKDNNMNERNYIDLICDTCDNYGAERFGVVIKNIEFVSLLIIKDDYILHNNILGFISDVKNYINQINSNWIKKSKDMIAKAIENTKAFIKYEFITLNRFKVTDDKRLVENYFAVFEQKKESIFACNGWLFGVNDPTINFALYPSWNYFTRSIIIWGDCAKLRYGNSPEDSPYLWKHMTKYVQDMALIFDGFRLDNAHSTPIFVAEYLMNEARKVNPNLIIMAELFAGSKERELSFIKKIGINLMIREAVYCSNVSELDEKLCHYGSGGKYHILGAIDNKIKQYNIYKEKLLGEIISVDDYKYVFPSYPKSIIYDITHDNPTLYEKYNNLSLNLTFMSCIAMSLSSVASTRGFDQLIPFQPSVVKENRLYCIDKDETDEVTHTFTYRPNKNVKSVKLALNSRNWKPDIEMTQIEGIYSAKLKLKKEIHYYKYVLQYHDNKIEWIYDSNKPNTMDNNGNINNILELGCNKDLKSIRYELNKMREFCFGKNNQFYLHRDRDLIAIFRTIEEYDFSGYAMICKTGYNMNNRTSVYRIELPGVIEEVCFNARIHISQFDINIIRSSLNLRGIDGKIEFYNDLASIHKIASIKNINGVDVLEFHSILPNTAILIKLKNPFSNNFKNIKHILHTMNEKCSSILSNLNLCDINCILYRCEKEELDNTYNKRGNYLIPDYGKLVYAGITHIYQIVQDLKENQNLSHPLFKNIREGDWLLEYTINRIKNLSSLSLINLDNFLSEYKSNKISAYKPYLFCKFIDTLYSLICKRIFIESNNLIELGELGQNLLIAVTQFIGCVESSKFRNSNISISAGLPHFSVEYMRCWGRDTFISFKGLLLIPGYYNEAREIIFNFARTMRHGLIPNLLDSGNKPRYNARDAVWLFLNSIKDYITFTHDYKILSHELEMIFLDDNMTKHQDKLRKGEKRVLKLYEVIQTILQYHASGIHFREWNAGKEIDEHMKDEGFNVNIQFDKSTGFIYGGNSYNCGTWMDKMGSSEKAKNKGIPATPRDGADIEIIAILHSFLIFITNNEIFPEYYPYDHVEIDQGILHFKSWSLLIYDNFETKFYIRSGDKLTKKENIYKDHLSITSNYTNYQLRPNFLIAMAINPQLFIKDHAIRALDILEKYLIVEKGIGVRTLDPEDRNYNGNYINSDDSLNFNTAHGFNYHNGPEWVWLFGYYIIARLNFCNDNETIRKLYTLLIPHSKYIARSEWKGIPELMNKNNTICPGSCNTQAWSIATIFEALYELSLRDNMIFE